MYNINITIIYKHMGKICTKCLKEKSLDRFSKHKHTLDKLNTHCKDCMKEVSRLHYARNKKKYKKRSQLWYKNNKEKARSYAIKYKEKINKLMETDPEFRKKYRDHENQKNREWCRKNPKKFHELQKRKSLKARSTPHGKLRHKFSSMLSRRLKRRPLQKKHSMLDKLPYSIDELKQRLEKLFKPGMTWENYGKWNIDHIIPDCSFKYKAIEDIEFQKSWALDNLQPLWAEENSQKGQRGRIKN